MAVNEFRHFIRDDTSSAYDKAWDEYHIYDGVHYLKQYSDDAEGFHKNYLREPHLMAIERIEKLLKFANPMPIEQCANPTPNNRSWFSER